MFSDIRAAEPDAQTYSLVRPATEDPSDVVDYAKSVLGSESNTPQLKLMPPLIATVWPVM
jgi:hypothetical protein